VDFHQTLVTLPPPTGLARCPSERALQAVLERFERLNRPVLHMLVRRRRPEPLMRSARHGQPPPAASRQGGAACSTSA
jgi:hypothetical protein